jgi:hypothetical protein
MGEESNIDTKKIKKLLIILVFLKMICFMDMVHISDPAKLI